MKNITNKSINEDYNIVYDMERKYIDAIYENQEAQKGHYDKQSKLVRLAMGDVRAGLIMAARALELLSNTEIIED